MFREGDRVYLIKDRPDNPPALGVGDIGTVMKIKDGYLDIKVLWDNDSSYGTWWVSHEWIELVEDNSFAIDDIDGFLDLV